MNTPLFHCLPLRSVFLYLTGRCNIACRYCYFRHKRRNKNLDEDFMRSLLCAVGGHPDCKEVRFILSGGEPLLAWPLLEKAVRAVRRSFFHNPIRVQSNASLMDSGKLHFLKQMNVGLEIGIDGSFISTARHRRGISEAMFKRIRETIACASRLGLPVSATMTVPPVEVDALLRNYSYLASLGLKNIDITPAAFLPWNARDVRRFKSLYGDLLDLVATGRTRALATSEDMPQPRMSWNISAESDGIVLPGDVFLCLAPSLKRRFSLMRFEKGVLKENGNNFRFFKEHFFRLAAHSGRKDLSARDYVIFSFMVLKKILPLARRQGCLRMSGLLEFIKTAHQKHFLK